MDTATIEKAQPGMGDEALSRLLFQTGGVRVLAVGPPACLRILYFRAMEKEALCRLRLCPVSRLEYTLGSYAHRVRGMIEELLMTQGTKGVVLYVSCPDLLIQTDFEALISEADNPYNVPVAVFRRGPMEKRKKKSVERLEEIIQGFGHAQENHKEGKEERLCPLPPLAADYSGALTAFEGDHSICACLVTGAGCASCPRSIDDFREQPFWYSRMNDLQVTLGSAESIEKGIDAAMQEDKRQSAFIVGTPLTAMTGLDDSSFPTLNEKVFIQTNGFQDALEGTKQALSIASRQQMRRCELTQKQINLVGYTPFVFGNQRQFDALVCELARLGYAVCWLGGGKRAELRDAPKARVNWVISAAGLELAKWMEKQYGTPWFYQMPVSVSGVRAACQALESITGDAVFQTQDTAPLKQELKNAVMIGDHELNRQISVVLKNEFNVECTIAEKLPLELGLAGEMDYVVADPLYFQYLPENAAVQVPLPFPALSGNRYVKRDYCIIGREGRQYLKQFFK
ncbi:nitrogenase component 1 [Eubacterium sp. 1001713B170207_170306_E7]|uniref:nitrogenase component 1 n=1 Tax=Eubacterium sp. 1001713B170207_170306_E7 TaxID=2787097 RepID=UPI001897133B|nr:nitrogenase component 1 [Eubacterium sp. 1001713B170207_170306_E7]